MRRLPAAAALVAGGLLTLPACAGGATTITEEVSYQIDQTVHSLEVDARAPSITIDVDDGPVTVTEQYRYSRAKPATTHQVDRGAVRLTESGCADDEARCDVGYRVRMPKTMSVDITAQAGAVMIDGLAANVSVSTQAGAVEGRALTSDQVRVTTEAGATSLEFAKAPSLVRTRTSMGAVRLRLPGTTAYAVDVTTSVGGTEVDVDRDPRSRHRIEVTTDVGGVAIHRLP